MIPANEIPLLSRRAQRWAARRTYDAAGLPGIRDLVARKRAAGATVSVGIPALNEAATIGEICRVIRRDLMEDAPLVDELVVLDGGSSDATAEIARTAGAEAVDIASLVPALPTVAGKGESLWRSLDVLRGDIVVWLDADVRNFGEHFVTRLVAPLLSEPEVSFVKAFYRRPIALADGRLLPSGGGRVTELTARPLLCALFPELAGFLQPLSGEYAGLRDTLTKVPFFTGYGVEAGLLIDLLELVGLDGLAQVDLGERVHRNRSLEELTVTAYAVCQTILRRAEDWGRIKSVIDYPANPILVPSDGQTRMHLLEDTQRPPMEVLAELQLHGGTPAAGTRPQRA